MAYGINIDRVEEGRYSREQLNPKTQKPEEFRIFECMLVAINITFGKPQIATVYRPTDTNFNDYVEELTSFLEKKQ